MEFQNIHELQEGVESTLTMFRSSGGLMSRENQ